MQALMNNPARVLPDGMKVGQNLYKVAMQGGLEKDTLELVHARVSQINGCSACLGTVDEAHLTERLWLVAAWRETPLYTDAERAALELAEAMTRIADRGKDVVTDEQWTELTKHYDEKQLGALIWWVATTNFYNRLNTTVREPAGARWD
jgi:alkylhydroperoxidase family enzyme